MLVVANHIHLTDPPLLGISLKRKVFFMAKEELFRSSLGAYFVRGLGSFPVHRGKLDRQALRSSQQVLADNLALAMFPEASRSRNARLKTAMPGSALIACRSGVPILPVDDRGRHNSYPLMRVQARSKATGEVLASSDIVVPVAAEADCQLCHAPVLDCAAVDPSLDCKAHGIGRTPFTVMTLDGDGQGNQPPGRPAQPHVQANGFQHEVHLLL